MLGCRETTMSRGIISSFYNRPTLFFHFSLFYLIPKVAKQYERLFFSWIGKLDIFYFVILLSITLEQYKPKILYKLGFMIYISHIGKGYKFINLII